MRTNGTIDPPADKSGAPWNTDSSEIFFVSHRAHMLRSSQLNRGEQATLRSLIQGPVAAMTAEHLSGLLDTGLEGNVRYVSAIASMRDRVLASGSRLYDLLDDLHREVPARFSKDEQIPAPSPTAVKIMLLEAVARQLGRDWAADCASFVDVTIASTRLQDAAMALAVEAGGDTVTTGAPFAALVLPRHEQHTLMSHLTGALFQTLGWQQQVVPHESLIRADVSRMVARADVICIGWSNMRLKPNVKRLISEIKSHCGHRTPLMIAGGAAALDSVEYLVELGINCICDSAYSAVNIAENFYNLKKINRFSKLEGSAIKRRMSRIDRQSL